MANPTEAEIKTQVQNAVKILDEIRLFGGVNATNFLNLEDILIQSLETDFPDQVSGAVESIRSSLNSAVLGSTSLLTPLILQYGKFIAAPETDLVSVLSRLYQYMVDNALTVQSRNYTFGTPVAGGGNIGTGIINRLNVDANNFKVESQFADAKVATIIQDSHSGAGTHEEVFEFRGATRERDAIKLTGSGAKNSQVKAFSALASTPFLDNPSFSEFTGVIAPGAITALAGWTPTTLIGNFQVDQTDFYRGFPGDLTPTALRISADDSIYQDLEVRRSAFDPTTPYYTQIAYNVTPGAITAGTLTIALGSQSVSVNLALAGAGWNILRLPIGMNNWFKNFNQTSFKFTITLAGKVGSYLLVDDVVLSRYVRFDGSYYAPVGGITKWLLNDKFTWADTEVGAKIQHWIWRSSGMYLPSTTGVPTWTDPV